MNLAAKFAIGLLIVIVIAAIYYHIVNSTAGVPVMAKYVEGTWVVRAAGTTGNANIVKRVGKVVYCHGVPTTGSTPGYCHTTVSAQMANDANAAIARGDPDPLNAIVTCPDISLYDCPFAFL